jgi:CRAL/TRIO domain
MKIMGSIWPLKLFFQYVQDAVSYNLKEIHVINVSPIIKSIFAVIKPFIKKELGDSIFFHSTHEGLHDIFELDVLPEEYGGNLGNISDIHKDYLNDLEKKSYVLKQYNFA